MAEEKKSGFVALVGRPNVGKSTLMNKLIGQKIAITSPKPQTTRNRIQTVYTDERGQVVFLDTPGMHKAKNRLGEYMVSVAYHTLKEADVILFLVEPESDIGGGDRYIMERLKDIDTPVFLVINKTDTKKREDLLPVIDAYRKLYDFEQIIPVSAMTGDNTDDLMNTVFSYLSPGPEYFDEDTVTDQPVRAITSELIREQALKNLSDEIPHGIAVVIERMEWGKRIVNVDATIICERDSHKGIIIGKGGAMLKKIGSAARYGIEELCGRQVNLKLWVKVKKDWRQSEYLLKNFGYDTKQEDDLQGHR
ncbi:MAG: GTPase Era [Lachnospiraceae bacterium]|nr:GTPase Era [Lachnospiraceae bacterium]